ncbi:Flavin-nucleotide-binding protein OS=Streptomyces glaucescens OX=1907 GN=SGLAU_05415 PE=4 SV=1 [Streptomyces glaucescens]
MIRLDLNEVSAKLRTGGVNERARGPGPPHWASIVPLRKGYDTPVADADLAPGTELPQDYFGVR